MYCLKDAWLPLRLMDKLSILINYVEMARVCGVPVDFLLSRGQQIKVMSMLLRKCAKANLVVPTLKREAAGEGGYEGATVIEPKKAYYQDLIATLDFASPYPSIKMAYNLCYSTLVPCQAKAKLAELGRRCPDSPSGDTFVTRETHRGLLPQILEELLGAQARKA